MHADHVVAAAVAYLRAGPAGSDTILILSGQLAVVLMHDSLLYFI
jgi:hypothetical protein